MVNGVGCGHSPLSLLVLPSLPSAEVLINRAALDTFRESFTMPKSDRWRQ